MSLKGSAQPGQKIVGRINAVEVLVISAYGIAVKNGFKGTEEEWLKSLEMSPEEVDEAVNKYLAENPVAIDDTLSVSGEAADAKATGDAIAEAKKLTQDHKEDTTNPHNVTKDQVGLGNVDNTADLDKPVSTAQREAIDEAFIELDAKKAESETYKGTFSSSGWSSSAPYTQTITVNGVLSTDYPFVDIDLSEVSDATAVIEAWKMVGRCTVSADNKVIAYCYEEKPTVAIPIVFKVVR